MFCFQRYCLYSIDMKEIWKDIEEYKGAYQVSNLGQVKALERIDNSGHLRKEMVLKQNDSRGYKTVILYKNGKPKSFQVHRLVAIAFIPNPNNLPQVNHKDENPGNNIVENLEWCDNRYNCGFGTRNKRISKNATGKHINRIDISRKVKQYSLSGTFIKEWESAAEIERQTGFDASSIGKCCRNIPKYKTARGYIWRFSECV